MRGQVDHGRAEDGPVARYLDARAEPDFRHVAQILDRGVDLPVQLEIADLGIGVAAADRGVDLVAAYREIVLVEPEALGDLEEAAVAHAYAPDIVGEAVGQA